MENLCTFKCIISRIDLYGNGLYEQMIFGESFEQISGSITPSPKLVIIASEYANNLYIQHCDGSSINWLEGVMLLGLYSLIAIAVWDQYYNCDQP